MMLVGQRRVFWLCFLTALTLIWTFIIFAQSAKNGEESTEDTNKVMEIIEEVADAMGVDWEISTHLVRKAAHFGEYMILGILGALLTAVVGGGWRCIGAFLYAASVAFCDEFAVQRFSEGRAPQLTDVLIDSAGAITGVVFVMAMLFLIKRKRKSNDSTKRENECGKRVG